MRRQKITGGKFFRPGLPRRSETKTGRGWIGLGVDTHGFTVGCFLPFRRRWGRPVLKPTRTAGKRFAPQVRQPAPAGFRLAPALRQSARAFAGLARPKSALRAEKPLCAGCRRSCAEEIRFARANFTLRGDFPVCADARRFCADEFRFAR